MAAGKRHREPVHRLADEGCSGRARPAHPRQGVRDGRSDATLRRERSLSFRLDAHVTGSRPSAIVVGAGIVGAACAATLARDGFRVTVLDADIPAGGTTAAGMGHLVAMDDSPEQLALTSYALTLWRDLVPELPSSVELEATGTLWIAEDDQQ